VEHIQHQMISEIPALRRYARALTRDIDAADDLVQDCLERAWKRQGLWASGSNLRAWLFTIMHNLYINGVRYRARRPITEPYNIEDHPDGLNHTPDIDIQLAELENALQHLPIEQREVLALVAVEGQSYKQVSKIIDVPVGTVMSRLHRGREELRKQLFSEPPVKLRRIK